MSTKIQIIQQFYEELGKGNPQGAIDLLTDDVVWIDPGYPDLPFAGNRKGKEQVMDFMMKMNNTVTYTQMEPQHFYNDGEVVMVKGFFKGTGNATGKSFTSPWMMLWKVNNEGKIKYYEAFVDTVNMANALR